MKGWLKRWRQRRSQSTWIYCPKCKLELIAGGEWIGQDVRDPAIEAYTCARCGTWSAWNFDAPAPLLVKSGADPYFSQRTFSTK